MARSARARTSASGASATSAAEPLEVDRKVRRRVPFGELVRLEAIEPSKHAPAADGGLRAPFAAGPDEGRIGEDRPCQIAGRVEEQRVVLAEIPHDVVAGLVHPVAEAEHGRVDFCERLCSDRVGEFRAGPEERHEPEIGAVVAVGNGRKARPQHRVYVFAALPGREHRQRPDRVRMAALGDMAERFARPRLECGRRRDEGSRVADFDAEGARQRETSPLQAHVECEEARRHRIDRAEHEAHLARLQHETRLRPHRR